MADRTIVLDSTLITLRAKYDHDAGTATAFLLPHAEMQVGSGAGGFQRTFETPIKFPALTDIKVTASVASNDAKVSVGLRGWLE